MERPDTVKFMILFIFIGVIMPVIFFTADKNLNDRARYYKDNGRQVTCYVAEVQQRILQTSNVLAYYFPNEKKAVYVNTVLNKQMRKGEEFEAYVAADPKVVFSPQYSVPRNTSPGLVALASALGWGILILYLYKNGIYRILSEAGKETEAELTSVERWDSNTLFGNFRFMNEAGKPRTARLYISRNIADVYENYRICYYESANGTIYAATADERLQK